MAWGMRMLPITAADTSKAIAAADLETDSTNTATARQYCWFTVRIPERRCIRTGE
jgi:hypothetical protein